MRNNFINRFGNLSDFNVSWKQTAKTVVNGVCVMNFESDSPVKGHKYHKRITSDAAQHSVHYSYE